MMMMIMTTTKKEQESDKKIMILMIIVMTVIMMMMMMMIAGLDSKRSDSTCGRHTIFIGTKPASMAMMDDKNLIDFLLEEIFRA